MKIASLQMRSTTDLKDNVRRACDYIHQAAAEGAQLIVLPEFFNTIYFAQYWDKSYHALAEPEDGYTLETIRSAVRKAGIDVIATIYEIASPGLYFDTAFHYAASGDRLHRYRKTHPSAVASLEKLYFRGGNHFDTYAALGWRMGIGICYDMSFPETARSLAVNGAELLIAPYATPRINMFQELLRTRAFENQCYLVAANKVGVEGEWTFGGGSLIADPTGIVLATAGNQDETLIFADIQRDAMTDARIAFPTRRDRRPDLYGALTAPVEA
jgi:N-carbamoylputrescine amidase